MTITAIRTGASFCLNPEAVGPDDYLPRVDNMTVPFTWTLIGQILKGNSSDFPFDEDCIDCEYGYCDYCGFTEVNLQFKREDLGYEEMLTDVEIRGILNPLFYSNQELSNGHHRLVALIDLGYTHAPTTDDENHKRLKSGIMVN